MIEKLQKTGIVDFPWKDEDEIYHPSKAGYLQSEFLGFCGCGDPNDTMLYVKEMLEKLDKHDWGSNEDRAYMFFVYWANNRGFAEHGVTARCSWLTPLGKELLRDMNDVISDCK